MKTDLPEHIAIVMDGNGRWAKEKGLPRYEGHRAGIEAVHRVVEFALRYKIRVLTLFGLSVENHEHRPQEEVQFLLGLLLESLKENTHKLHEKKVRIRIIGDRSQFSSSLSEQISQTEALTSKNTVLQLVLAINYSGRWDILQATRRLFQKIAVSPASIKIFNDHQFASCLCLSDLPDPDLLIRTGGELRVSNFMLWQFAYTELFFPKEYWPDFNDRVFQNALTAYRSRQRRFGLTSEQVESMRA